VENKGFTLIELLVVAIIIGVLSAFVLANYPSYGREFALDRSANKLAQDIRRAQEKAVAMEEISGSPPQGYGVYFNTSTHPSSYKLSAYEKEGSEWSATDTWEDTISLESKVKLKDLKVGGSSVSTSSIVFEPPDPTIWIIWSNNNSSSSSSTVILYLETEPSKTKSILVNSSGLITTE